MGLTVRKKLLGFGFTTVVLGMVIWIAAYWGLSRTAGALDRAVEAAEAQRNQMGADMMHDALRADVFAALLADKNDTEEVKKVGEDVAKHAKNMRLLVAENRKHIVGGEALKMLNAVAPIINAYADQAEKLVALTFAGEAAARSQLSGFLEMFKRLEDEMEQLSDRIAEDAKEARASGDRVVGRTKTFMAVFVLVVILLMAACAYLIGNSISRPLEQTLVLLKDIAEGEGDLTKRLEAKSRDEVGEVARWFNTFIEKVHDIVVQVRGVADHVTVGSQALSAAGAQLSIGAQQQASSLEETAASLEELTGTVKLNADNARQADQLAVSSRDNAEKGGQVVTSAVDAMVEINQASKKIADIVTTIDEIAFQTNLLALNAAVEAARAGEQGRGFAVVAAEVRNLAQRSAAAAREIKVLIQDSVQKVEAGSVLVNQSGQALEKIVTSVKHVTNIVAEIAGASQEQSLGIDQINRAVTQMDQATQSNAAQTEELSSTARSLAAQAEQLQAVVGRFKLDKDGVKASTTAVHTPQVVANPSMKSMVSKLQPRKEELTAHVGNGATHPVRPDNGSLKGADLRYAQTGSGFEEF